MARFSKRMVFLVLLIFIILSVALRYPLVEHERQQTDSYFVHMLASSIVSNGYAKWVFHPLSFFGYYPFSYPSGVPFLLAEVSSLTGLGMEASVLLFDMVLAMLFCLVVFALSMQFLKRPEYVLLATLFAILGARFVDTTYWDASARGPIVVMIALVVMVLFRVAATKQRYLYLFAFIFGLGCFVVHHMAVLLLAFALAYVLAVFQIQYLHRHIRSKKRAMIGAFNVFVLSLVIVISYVVFSFFRDVSLANVDEGSLFNFEPTLVAILMNMAVSYTNQIGFILPVAILGLPSLFLKSRLAVETLFPVTLLIAFVPLLGSSLYVSMIIAPFIAIMGTVWLSRIFGTCHRRRLVVALIILLIASSVALPVVSIQRWNNEVHFAGDRVAVDNQLFNDAGYLTWCGNGGHAISNVNALSLQLSAISEVDFLGSELFLPLSDDVTPADIEGNTVWSTARFPVNLYKWFEYENQPRVDGYIKGLMVYGFDYIYGKDGSREASDYFSSHSNLMVVFDNARPLEYADSFSTRPAELTLQLLDASWTSKSNYDYLDYPLESYCFYQSEGSLIFLLSLPD